MLTIKTRPNVKAVIKGNEYFLQVSITVQRNAIQVRNSYNGMLMSIIPNRNAKSLTGVIQLSSLTEDSITENSIKMMKDLKFMARLCNIKGGCAEKSALLDAFNLNGV